MALIYLCGITGVGKSSIGRELAHLLQFAFIDVDEKIVDESCMTIAEIFEEEGELRFREREAAEIAKTAAHVNTVVALGGGAVIIPENLRLILQTGTLVYLRAPAAHITQRVFGDPRRPMLAGYDTPAELEAMLERLLAQRKPLYEQAHLLFDVQPVASIAENAHNLYLELKRRQIV